MSVIFSQPIISSVQITDLICRTHIEKLIRSDW